MSNLINPLFVPGYPPVYQSQQGYGQVTTLITTLFSGSTASGTSSVEVSDYNTHVFQPSSIISGSNNATASYNIYSSIDGNNWRPDLTNLNFSNSSSFITLSGRRRYFQAYQVITGNCTGSLYLISGQ